MTFWHVALFYGEGYAKCPHGRGVWGRLRLHVAFFRFIIFFMERGVFVKHTLHWRGVWGRAVSPHDIFYVLLEIMEINRLTHSRDDLCGIQSYYSQSVGPGRYTTTNLNPKATGVNPIASDQLLMYPREGFGFNNAAIDADSMLRNQIGFTNQRCQIRPQSRPFLTIPFMAGGSPSRDVESLLLHSEQVRMGKECGTVSEQFFSQQYTPMIPILKDNIQNPKNIISEVAAPGWIHGGIPSRSYLRDINC